MSSAMHLCLRLLQSKVREESEKEVFKWSLRRRQGFFFGDARGRARQKDGVWAKESIGGVLFIGGQTKFFVAAVTEEWDRWLGPSETDGTRRQRINIAEGMPFLLALTSKVLGPLMEGADIQVYIDNSAAEWCLRKPKAAVSTTASIYLFAVTAEVWRLVDKLGIRLWVWRVPSELNVADPLSRNEIQFAIDAKWDQIAVELPKREELLWIKDLLMRAKKKSPARRK